VSRKGKYYVRFTPEMAGLLSIRFAIGGESLVNPDDGRAVHVDPRLTQGLPRLVSAI